MIASATRHAILTRVVQAGLTTALQQTAGGASVTFPAALARPLVTAVAGTAWYRQLVAQARPLASFTMALTHHLSPAYLVEHDRGAFMTAQLMILCGAETLLQQNAHLMMACAEMGVVPRLTLAQLPLAARYYVGEIDSLTLVQQCFPAVSHRLARLIPAAAAGAPATIAAGGPALPIERSTSHES